MNGGEERSNKFRVDKMVPTESAKSADYTKSGYDRGHLCPAADMGFNPVAMEESFLMSNISPQAPDFNRGIWKELETTVREWAKKEHRLIVVTGPVFKDNKGTIGQENILVPGYFYKVVYDLTGQPRMIAFVLPNAKSDRPLTDFAVSADEVEKLTGLDFFSQLPDDEENKLEATVQLSGWFDRYKTTAEHVAAKQSQQKQSPDSDKNFYLILVVVILLAILFVFLRGKRKR
jgi:endonuclease G